MGKAKNPRHNYLDKAKNPRHNELSPAKDQKYFPSLNERYHFDIQCSCFITIRCLTGVGWKSTNRGQSRRSELLERVATITLYSHTIHKQHVHMPGFPYISKNHFPYFFNTFSTLNLISSILLLLFIFRNS